MNMDHRHVARIEDYKWYWEVFRGWPDLSLKCHIVKSEESSVLLYNTEQSRDGQNSYIFTTCGNRILSDFIIEYKLVLTKTILKLNFW